MNNKNKAPDLTLIPGGHDKVLDEFFGAILGNDFATADRVKREKVLPRQRKKPKLTKVK